MTPPSEASQGSSQASRPSPDEAMLTNEPTAAGKTLADAENGLIRSDLAIAGMVDADRVSCAALRST